MNEGNNRGYGVETWVLCGISAYVLVVLFVLYVRYCILKKTFCPFSKCGLYATCELADFRKNFACRTCDSASSCCNWRRPPKGACCDEVPTLRCVCFAPNCSYCYLFCCEASLDYEFESKLIGNPVQNI